MSNSQESFNPFDPTGVLKGMRDSSMEAWSKMMLELVNTDAYAEATGRMLDTWLSSSAPMRKLIDKGITQSLSNLNMPSAEDVTKLNSRLTNIEMRLDDLDIRLDNIQNSLKSD